MVCKASKICPVEFLWEGKLSRCSLLTVNGTWMTRSQWDTWAAMASLHMSPSQVPEFNLSEGMSTVAKNLMNAVPQLDDMSYVPSKIEGSSRLRQFWCIPRLREFHSILCYILRRHLWQLFGFPYVELHKVLWMFYSHPKQLPRSECKWISTDGHMQVRVKSFLACQTQVRCRQGSVSFT